MKSFTIPLYIQGTEEEVRALLPELIALGYRERPYLGRGVSAIITHYSAQDEPINTLSLTAVSYSTFKETEFHQPRLLVNASDKELVLALAAMTDEQEAREGEIWAYDYQKNDPTSKEALNFYKIEDRNHIYSFIGLNTIMYSDIREGYVAWRRATKEEIINLYQPSKAKEEEFPEKWCINANALSKVEKDFLREHVDSFKNKYGDLTSLTYSNQSFRYYHFINLVPINTGEQHPISGYTEVTFSQFKKHIENITNMDKKIIGYKPKAGVELEAAARALGEIDISSTVKKWNQYIQQQGWAFTSCSYNSAIASKIGILDLLFEPVYEPEKPKEKTIKLGSNALDIVIYKDGSIKIPSLGAKTDVGSVEKLLNSFNTINQYKIAGYSISLSSDNRFLRIGCSGDNNLFSINELQLVLDTYKALQ